MVGRRKLSRAVARARRITCALTLALLAAGAAPAAADVLKGVVRDSLGHPAFNADFDVFTTDGMLLEADDNSDADGSYEILLPAGRYDVVCEPVPTSGLAPTILRGIEVAGETRLDWVLPSGYRVLGRVLGPDGPVAGADLDFDESVTGQRQPSTGDLTSPFGTFAANIAAGTYRLSVFPTEASGLAPAAIGGVTVPGPDTLLITLVRAAHLSGTATTRTGVAVANARLTQIEAATGARVPVLGSRTDAAGRYRVAAAPGRYRLRITPPRGDGIVPLETPPLDLAGDLALDHELDTGPTLSGQVRARDGRPLAGADWDVFDAITGASLYTGDDDTDESGHYAITLPDGLYRLVLTPPPASGLDTLGFDAFTIVADRVFDVDFSRVSGPAGAALAIAPLANPSRRGGGVLLSLPVAGRVRVEVFDAAGRRVRVLADGLFESGAHAFEWDGRNAAGTRVGAGVYFLRALREGRAATARWVVLP